MMDGLGTVCGSHMYYYDVLLRCFVIGGVECSNPCSSGGKLETGSKPLSLTLWW